MLSPESRMGGAPRVAVVLNPNSRKNRGNAPRRAAQARRILGSRGVVFETPGVADLRPVVEGLLSDGVEYLVADGGDGCLHWVLNEARTVAADTGRTDPLPAFLPTNGGTIDFVARKAGIHGHAPSILTELVRRLDRGEELPLVDIDSLHLTGIEVDAEGRERVFDRLGFAVAAGGIGQRFFDKYYLERNLGGPAIVKVVARAVGSFAADKLRLPLPARALSYGREVFAPTLARVWVDGSEVPTLEHGAIHAGAFELVLGNVFRVFPLARQPGKLHFQAGAIVPTEMIRALPDLVRGGAIPSERLVERAGTEMVVEAISDELLAPVIDGEMFSNLKRLEIRRGPKVKIAAVAPPRGFGRARA